MTHPTPASRLALALPAFLAFSIDVFAQCGTQRVSVDSMGAEANGDSGLGAPNVNRNYLSGDGRFIAFWSTASNLVPNDTNGVADVFLRDRVLNTTTRISVDSAGLEADGASTDPAVSSTGRYIVFASAATNLAPGDLNGKTDIFLRDVLLSTTTRVSVDTNGNEGNGDNGRPDISADARFVVWHGTSSNLATQDTNATQDVFVTDRITGITNCLSVDATGISGDAFSGNPAVSANGRFVAFHSLASNLVSGDLNQVVDVFVRDRGTFTTTRVSTNTIGEEGEYASQTPSISADGRYVAFASAATTLVPADTNNLWDVFRKDRTTGITRRCSVNNTLTQGNSVSQNGSISADGRFVAFISAATNLVANDTNGGVFNLNTDVFVRDMIFNNTTRASVDTFGAQANDAGSSYNVCLSADASTVAFYSGATNLVSQDTNGFFDVFARSCGDPPIPTQVCWGDGSGAPCPCGNAGSSERGCENSFSTGGGRITGSGASRLAGDTFTITLSGLPPSAAVMFIQGDQVQGAGAGIAFGDGLLCAGGSIVRLGVRFCIGGQTSMGFQTSDVPLSQTGMIPSGTTSLRYYQGWYRDIAAFCTNDLYNLTSGLVVTWVP